MQFTCPVQGILSYCMENIDKGTDTWKMNTVLCLWRRTLDLKISRFRRFSSPPVKWTCSHVVSPGCWERLLLTSSSSLSQSASWVPETSGSLTSGTPDSEWPGTRWQLLSRDTDWHTLLQVRSHLHFYTLYAGLYVAMLLSSHFLWMSN